MSIIGGCQDGKATPKLTEILCPECGNEIEVFVRLGGKAGETGTIVSDETCDKCGYVVKSGTPDEDLKKA